MPGQRGWLRQVLRGVLILTGLALSVVASLLLHLNLPKGRALLAANLGELLSREYEGRFVIQKVKRLGLGALEVGEVRIFDVEGREVLVLSNVSTELSGARTLYALATQKSKITLSLARLRIERARLALLPGPDRETPSLLRAFDSREPTEARFSRRSFRLWFPSLDVEQVAIRSTLPQLPEFSGELSRIHADVLFAKGGLAVELSHLGLRLATASGVRVEGEGHLSVRTQARTSGQFSLSLGKLPANIEFELREGTLEARLTLPELLPEELRRLWPAYPLTSPTKAALTAQGPLKRPKLHVELHSANGRLSADLIAEPFAVPFRLSGEIEVAEFDLRELSPQLWPSRLTARAALDLVSEISATRARLVGRIEPGTLADQATPPADFVATLEPEGSSASVVVHERSTTLRLATFIHPSSRVDIDAALESPDLARAERLTKLIGESAGRVSTRWLASLEDDQLTLSATGELVGVAWGGLRGKSASFVVAARGPVAAPNEIAGSFHFQARELSTPIGAFEHASLELTGTLGAGRLTLRAHEPRQASVELRAASEFTRGLALSQLRGSIERRGATLDLRGETLTVGKESLSLPLLILTGSFGELELSAARAKDRLTLAATTDSILLGELARALGARDSVLEGHLHGSLGLEFAGGERDGHLELAVDGLAVGGLPGIAGTMDARLSGRELVGSLRAASPTVGALASDFEFVLEDGSSELLDLSRTTGHLDLTSSDVALEAFANLLSPDHPLRGLEGRASAQLAVERTDPNTWPDATLNLAASGHWPSGLLGSATGTPPNPVELRVGSGFDGATRRADVELSASHAGTPALTATVRLAWPESVPTDQGMTTNTEPASAATTAAAELGSASSATGWSVQRLVHDWLPRLSVQALVTVPPRRLSSLREFTGPVDADATLSGKLLVTGALDAPRLVLDAKLTELSFAARAGAPELGATVTAEYVHETGEWRLLSSLESESKPVANLTGSGWLSGFAARSAPAAFDWAGQLEASWLGLPIEAVPGLPPEWGLSGKLRGSLALSRNDGLTRLTGLVPIDEARLASLPLGQVLLGCEQQGSLLMTQLRLFDGGAEAEIGVSVPLETSGPVPRLERRGALQVTARMAGYDAQLLRLALGESVGDLGGRLDADLTATLEPAEEPGGGVTYLTKLGGRASLSGGHLTLEELGFAVTDISLRAQASSTGRRTTLTIPEWSAALGAPQPNLFGTAAVSLDDLALERMQVTIDRAERVPLIVAGVTRATLRGSANLTLVPERRAQRLDISIQPGQLELELPTELEQDPVELDDNPAIVILQPMHERSARRAKERLRYQLDLTLPANTRVKRADLSLPISGFVRMDYDQQLSASGTVLLGQGGRLSLFGRVFVIERGTVVLDPEQLQNPRLDVTAVWRGSTHLVTARVQGTAEEARLSLSSDPPSKNEAEVQALLLGTRTDDTASASAGAGVGAALLNQAFSGTALQAVELSTSVDREHANYTAAVPLRENLWFEATYKSPETSAARPGDTTREAGFSGTIDYRFDPNWSLRTELGSLGAGLDLLWQYRY